MWKEFTIWIQSEFCIFWDFRRMSDNLIPQPSESIIQSCYWQQLPHMQKGEMVKLMSVVKDPVKITGNLDRANIKFVKIERPHPKKQSWHHSWTHC